MNIRKPTTERRAMWNGNRFEKLFAEGIAVGQSDIVSDVVHFRFREEQFSIPTFKLTGILRWSGYFYEAPVKKLRKMAG